MDEPDNYNSYSLKPNFSSDLAAPVDGRVPLHQFEMKISKAKQDYFQSN